MDHLGGAAGVNATAMCQAAGKKFHDFYRAGTTEAYFNELTLIRMGGKPLEQGTWIHPFAVHALAMWCSPKFHVQVTVWLDEWRADRLAPAPSPVTSDS
jgi:hypothetical protein